MSAASRRCTVKALMDRSDWPSTATAHPGQCRPNFFGNQGSGTPLPTASETQCLPGRTLNDEDRPTRQAAGWRVGKCKGCGDLVSPNQKLTVWLQKERQQKMRMASSIWLLDRCANAPNGGRQSQGKNLDRHPYAARTASNSFCHRQNVPMPRSLKRIKSAKLNAAFCDRVRLESRLAGGPASGARKLTAPVIGVGTATKSVHQYCHAAHPASSTNYRNLLFILINSASYPHV